MRHFNRKIKNIIVLSLLLFSVCAKGATPLLVAPQDTILADSVANIAVADDPTHRFRPAEFIVPGGVAVLGAVCVNSSWGKHWRNVVQHSISANGRQKWPVDDYVQYAPVLAANVLPFLGVKGQHEFGDRIKLTILSAATMAAVVNVAKYTFKERRPDSGARNSFPSGHTATAFMGAEILYQEYRNTHPWIGYSGYALATAVAVMRIHNDRHWVNDVFAGAAVGMLSTKFAYWLYPRVFHEGGKGKRGKHSASFVGMPYYGGHSAGMNMAIVF